MSYLGVTTGRITTRRSATFNYSDFPALNPHREGERAKSKTAWGKKKNPLKLDDENFPSLGNEPVVKPKIVETRKEEDICSICRDEVGEGTSYLDKERLPCGHLYHKGCISRWLENHNSCPECRASISRGTFKDGNIQWRV